MKPEEILELRFSCRDLNDDDISVKDYFKALLATLFEEGEGFSGKRPFGNSGWERDLIKCFVTNKVIKGKLDSEGYVDSYDEKAFYKALYKAIGAL